MLKHKSLSLIRRYLNTVADGSETVEDYKVVVKHLQCMINDLIDDELKQENK